MRQIKFRAWDSNQGKMWSHEDLDNSDKDGVILWGFLMAAKESGFTLMQFTGLYDKEGKAIYEGDIVASKYNGGSRIGEIIDGSQGVIRIGAAPDMTINCEEYSLSYFGVWADVKLGTNIEDRCDFDSWVVIGNIYQNPELLEQSHVSD